jgi:hypothetical protein
MIRLDISKSLIHLTRDRDSKTSEEVFDQIISDKSIIGSTENIRGKYKCICFSETPISAIGQIIALKDEKFHYGSFGFIFSKQYLFNKGARPVIYQPDSDFELLPENLQYRHVRFEIDRTDWTWEREWRICIDKLELDYKSVTLIVPTREKIEEYKEKYFQVNRALSLASEGLIRAGKKLEWHFISLEDLGY